MSELAGDDLAIVLFSVSTALVFGLETMKAETSARKFLFGIFTILFLANGVFWLQIKKIWPPFSEAAASVATNPAAWFVVLMFALGVIAFHPAKPKDRTNSQIGPEPLSAAKPEPEIAAPSARVLEVPTQPESRVFVDIAPADLIGLYRTRTSIQAKALIAPHIGKWISVTGPISNVNGNVDRLWVTLHIGGALVSASCSKPESERAIHFTNETVVTVQGRIEEVDRISVSLVDSHFS